MIIKYRNFLHFDWLAVIPVAFLLASGLIAIYSLSLDVDKTGFSNFDKQIIFLALGIGVFIIFSFVDYRLWKSWSGALYAIGILLMLAVLVFGKDIRGTSGWFVIGPFRLQPAEIMKLFLILGLASYFSRFQTRQIGLKQIGISFVYVLIPAALAAFQPDMGSALVMLVIWFGMLFLTGVKSKYILGTIGVGVLILLVGWNMILQDYQRQRINSFFNPEGDPLGSGYNVIQSMVAIGSGGISGKGLGHGSQSQLNFLPEKHNDFIFASIAEESGLIGVALILGLFWLLLFRMKRTMDVSRDNFGRLIVGGVIVLLFFQAFINIGMNLGIVPVAGLSLPLLSYGGSFLMVTMAAVGLTQSVWRKREKSSHVQLSE